MSGRYVVVKINAISNQLEFKLFSFFAKFKNKFRVNYYERVTRYRTCLICGKPDWCSYTPDGKISFCARITHHADRLSRTGWGVYYHQKSLFGESPLPFPRKPPLKKVKLAPLKIRDFVYRKLIELSPALNFSEIIEGPKGLCHRRITNYENFGGLPHTYHDRLKLVNLIRSYVNFEFPEYVREFKTSLSGIPGFWIDKHGRYQLWSDQVYSSAVMIIPYRNPQGMIQSCQLRFMSDTGNNLRYVWLSTPNKSGGVSCGSPVHFVRPLNSSLFHSNQMIVTEGALKGETLQGVFPNSPIAALGGIASSHSDFIKSARYFSLYIAFDTDYFENPQVLRQLARFIKSRLVDARINNYKSDLHILFWSINYKGIDDALLHNQSINVLSLTQWLSLLNPPLKNDFLRILRYNLP